MATVFVNDVPVEIGDAKLNVIQAAQRAGVFVPHYCWHAALTVVASCRMCLVEMGERKQDGSVTMQPKVIPGCQTPVKDGSVIVTADYGKTQPGSEPPPRLNYPSNYGKPGERAKKAQADTLEAILLNHPLDCPVCDKAGECKLQDFSYDYGRTTTRMIDVKNAPANKPGISSSITLFTDRCIMCSRCVRFTREISGTSELQVLNRGDRSEIDIFPGAPLENKLAGNVVDLCPVGALGSKDFLYKQRVWYLQSTPSVCPLCSTGCNIDIDANKDIVYRLRPRENHQAQGFFICDDGRYGYHYANSPERIKRPQGRQGDALVPVPWRDLLPSLRRDLADAALKNASQFVGVFSPFLTCEEAYLLAVFLKGLSKDLKLVLGPIPDCGDDESYPKDRRGRPVQPAKFTIRAEKCPNRRGVEEVLKHFQGNVVPFPDVIRGAQSGSLNAVLLTAGYPNTEMWVTSEVTEALRKAGLLIVQDLFSSPLSQAANYVLPATSFAERDGTYINYANLAQTIHRAARPPQQARTEGQVYLDLLERRGLIQAAVIRKEMALAIPFFRPLASELGGLGIRLG
jgi:NADH-quinone oxidoreductase subunit G